MSEQPHAHPDELSREEIDALYAAEVPKREVLSVLRIPWLTGVPVEATPEPTDLPDE
jgi:hypothetical protein